MARCRTQRLAVAAALAVSVGGVTLGVAPGSALAAASPQQALAGSSIFRIDHSPQPAGSSLRASTAIAADDVWAVGYQDTGSPLAEHFDGTSWSVVATPNPDGTSFSRFTAVSAVSSTDVWAIGVFGPRQANVPFTEHWDGNTWSIVSLKDPTEPNNNVVFTGVKAISPTSVYAVGAYQGLQDPVQFIEHWNGTRWRVQPNPFDFVIPEAIDGSSASDIWIVGNQRYGAFTEHYDGTAWSVVTSPSPYGPSGVVDLSPTDAWTVGTLDVQHWNGRTWQVVKSPNTVELQAVTALSPNDIWAVGFNITFPERPRAEHWDGHRWSVVHTPHPKGDSFLSGVSSAPDGHVYAVGSSSACGTCGQFGLILQTDQG